MAYLVHDAIAGAGVEILSFNAHQLRMIASSRKKTDRRDAYWIARALQSGMYPHPVYIPAGEIRERLEKRREETGISYVVIQGRADLERFAEEIVERVPGLEQVRLVSSGTEAKTPSLYGNHS